MSPPEARGKFLLLIRRPKLLLHFLVFPGKGEVGPGLTEKEELFVNDLQSHWNSLPSSAETLKSMGVGDRMKLGNRYRSSSP